MPVITNFFVIVYATSLCLFILLLTLSVLKLIMKNRFNVSTLLPVVRWSLLGIAFISLISHVMYFSNGYDLSVFLEIMRNRHTYTIMLFGDLVFPFILFSGRASKHIFILLLVSFFMNLGRIMELIIMFMASHRDYF